MEYGKDQSIEDENNMEENATTTSNSVASLSNSKNDDNVQ